MACDVPRTSGTMHNHGPMGGQRNFRRRQLRIRFHLPGYRGYDIHALVHPQDQCRGRADYRHLGQYG